MECLCIILWGFFFFYLVGARIRDEAGKLLQCERFVVACLGQSHSDCIISGALSLLSGTTSFELLLNLPVL